jgi:hypothetical protein
VCNSRFIEITIDGLTPTASSSRAIVTAKEDEESGETRLRNTAFAHRHLDFTELHDDLDELVVGAVRAAHSELTDDELRGRGHREEKNEEDETWDDGSRP